jgi:uncharacterized membrane protein
VPVPPPVDEARAAEPGALTGATSTGVDPRLAAVLSYTAWWVSGLVFLFIEQQHRGVRFHAAQSLVLFGGFSVVIAVLSMLNVGMLIVSASAFQAARMMVSAVWIAAVVLWLVLMIRTLKGDTWRVPLVAEMADRLAGK